MSDIYITTHKLILEIHVPLKVEYLRCLSLRKDAVSLTLNAFFVDILIFKFSLLCYLLIHYQTVKSL